MRRAAHRSHGSRRDRARWKGACNPMPISGWTLRSGHMNGVYSPDPSSELRGARRSAGDAKAAGLAKATLKESPYNQCVPSAIGESGSHVRLEGAVEIARSDAKRRERRIGWRRAVSERGQV